MVKLARILVYIYRCIYRLEQDNLLRLVMVLVLVGPDLVFWHTLHTPFVPRLLCIYI